MSSDWVSGLTVAKLKDELKKRSLPVGGLKAELSARLLQALSGEKEPDNGDSSANPDQPQPDAEDKPAAKQPAAHEGAENKPSSDAAPKDSPAPHATEIAPSVPPVKEPEASAPHAKDAEPGPAPVKDAEPSPAPVKHAEPGPASAPVKHAEPSPAPEKDAEPSPAGEQSAEPSPASETAAEPSPAPAEPEAAPAPAVPAPAVVLDQEAEVEEVDYGLDEVLPQPQSEVEPSPEPPAASAPIRKASPAPPAQKDTQPQQQATALHTEPSLETAGSGWDENQGRKRRAPIQFQPKQAAPAAATPSAAAEPSQPLKVAIPSPATLERKLTAPSPAAAGPALPPPAGPPTCAMRIDNLVRPFMEQGLRALISQTGTIKDFWMPSIKTHAFVIMETEEQGAATCAALHGLGWPQSSPKRLLITYLTAEEAQQGINVGRDPAKLATSPSGGMTKQRSLPPTTTQQAAEAAPKPVAKVGMGAVAAAKAAMAAAAGSAKNLAAAVTNNNKRARSASPGNEGEAGAEAGDKAGSEGGDEPAAKRPHVQGAGDDGVAEPGAGDGPMEVEAQEPEPEPVTLDTLFRKTAAKPALYWLPLTMDQIKEKHLREEKEAAEAQALEAMAPPPMQHHDPMLFNGGARGGPRRGPFYGNMR